LVISTDSNYDALILEY